MSYEKACKNKDFCGIVMPSEKKKILEFNQYMKSNKVSCIIYADIESLIRKIDRCANNPKKSSKMKIVQPIPCEYSMSTVWEFDLNLCCGKDCIKKFCDSLIEYAKNIILFEKKQNVTFNKRRIKIISRGKSILYLWKRNTREVC